MDNTVNVRGIVVILAALLVVTALPAWAQVDSGVAGVVSDATGAVLPGVTVEASSPALIEGVRVSITDGAGRYNITALRPGTYSVTFTLPGFSTFVRDGIELTGGFTANVNGEMSVGALEETVTVSGASPLVDIQNSRAQEVIERETFDALPVVGGYSGLQVLTVGALGSLVNPTRGRDVGGVRGDSYSGAMEVHGNSDGKLSIDGKPTSYRGTRMTLFHINQQSVEEITVDIGGNSAETQYGGSSVNIITKDGGNIFTGSFAGNFGPPELQSDNLDDDIRARGIDEGNQVKRLYDVSGSFGGPIARDKLWFYTAHRVAEAQEFLAGLFYNKNQGQFPPSYEEDHSQQAFSKAFDRDNQIKFTWQAAEKHKLNFQWILQHNCGCFFAQGEFYTPEATTTHFFAGDFLDSQHLVNGTWTYPATNRLLLEAKASYWYVTDTVPLVEGSNPDDIAVWDQGIGKAYGQLFNRGLFRLQASWIGMQGPHGDKGDTSQEFKVSYVTGSHSFKTGIQSVQQRYNEFATGPSYTSRPPIAYVMFNGTPTSLAQLAAPNFFNLRMTDLGAFAQDAWTIDRLTLNLGVRYDYTTSYAPEFTRPAGYFLDEITWPAQGGFSGFHDITPRFAAAYDLTGSGRTALKFSFGRYVLNEGMSRIFRLHPSLAITDQVTRTWNDTNGDFLPDCDLRNNLLNGECGATSGAGFGTTRPITGYTDEARLGWFNRPYTWTTSILLEHELAPGIAASVGYYRTTNHNIVRPDNRLAGPADYDEYCVTTPSDSRFPGGGGNDVCGLFDIKPSLFGQVDTIYDHSNWKQWYNGIDVLINARFDNGAFIAGGFNTGETRLDRCDAPDFPEQFCDRANPPWSGQHNFKFHGSYPLPWWNLVTSATFLNLPGIQRNAQTTVRNAQIEPALGRDLAGCGTRTGADCSRTVTVKLYPDNSEFTGRQTQVDWRLATNIEAGGARIQPRFEIYNLFNANDIQGLNSQYTPGPTNPWLNITGILTARLFKFAVQIDF